VLQVNPLVEKTPELVHRDPYGDGWLARLALHDFDTDRRRLVQGAAAIEVMVRHAVAMAHGE